MSDEHILSDTEMYLAVVAERDAALARWQHSPNASRGGMTSSQR